MSCFCNFVSLNKVIITIDHANIVLLTVVNNIVLYFHVSTGLKEKPSFRASVWIDRSFELVALYDNMMAP